MFDTITMPSAAKTLQLYGLDKVHGPTKKLCDRSEAFVKSHGCPGMLIGAFGWVPIKFDLAQLGAYLSSKLAARGVGDLLSDAIGYTIACVHPSIMSLAVKKLVGVKDSGIGIPRYLEAAAVAEIPALLVFITTFSAVVHSGVSPLVSMGRAVCAAVASTLLASSIWPFVFAPYWAKYVRAESSASVFDALKEFGRGWVSGITPWKRKTTETAYEEAGAITGTGFFIFVIPWCIVRTISAASVALVGTSQEDFSRTFFSAMAGLEWLGVLLSSVELSIVEGIIKRRNGEASPP
ncbi:hypothetical protein H0O00_00615 [Candidatus Micrarchaeota archaeon]|nr:hypothetical protein [Candidatus Micrarchaeota archaeon]